MTERTRQSLGGLLLAFVLLVVGLLLRSAVTALGGVLVLAAIVIGLVALISVGLDLVRGEKARD